jgi:lysophospholipase L1-like esterase
LVYQRDIQEFLSHPLKRIQAVRLNNEGYPTWTWNYEETPRTMVGLQIDWSAWKVVFPPGADQNQIDTVKAFLMYPVAPQTGRFAAYRRQWFGKIIDRYRGSPTKIVFVRLARGPIPRPGNLVRKKSSSIREFARRPNVLLMPEHAFDSLEHPEFYKDGMHLNREGAARFSTMLAEEVAKLLGPPSARGAAR